MRRGGRAELLQELVPALARTPPCQEDAGVVAAVADRRRPRLGGRGSSRLLRSWPSSGPPDASGDPLGGPKTNREGAKRAAKWPKMGAGDREDGPGGFGDSRKWPGRPQESRKRLQKSSKKTTEGSGNGKHH